MTTIVILELKAEAPGNATWCCFLPPWGSQKEKEKAIWEMMGHKCVDVPDEKADELLKSMGASMMLQFELRELCYPKLPPPTPTPSEGAPIKKSDG